MVESARPPAPETGNPFILPGELPSLPKFSLQPLRSLVESMDQRRSALRRKIPGYAGRVILIGGLLLGGGAAVWSYGNELSELGRDTGDRVVDFFRPQPINFVKSDFGKRVEPMP